MILRKAFVTLLVCFAALGTRTAHAYQFPEFVEPYFDMVDETFDKESAFNTVAFVEKYWRVVGNEGFDKSIYHVVEKLKSAGFVEESAAGSSDRLVYRIEKRPLKNPTWEPVSGILKLGSGDEILNFETNFNMMAMHSYSTGGEKEFEVVYVGEGRNLDLNQDLTGKVVYGETSVNLLFNEAVKKKGAVGVIGYRLPGYLKPDKNVNSIQFTGIPRDDKKKSFGILLSHQANKKLKAAIERGENKIRVNLETKIWESEELTLVAELRGSKNPEERFVFSAHVQEPGANDNASGVGALAEVAASSARLLKAGKINPERTITYLFGDEIVSTRRFIQEDKERAKNIKWGMSLDMVGENTSLTGGTFLIEKMPDPGSIWVRGVEKHSEWGGRPLTKKQLKPHYFNDLTINVFQAIGKKKNWTVKFNPYEGGSDHVPFLRGNIPGVLLWHFTDQFYHTDGDRIDKVSAETLGNVGTGALVIALMLTENKEELGDYLLDDLNSTLNARLADELKLSEASLANGGDKTKEVDILSTWADYYMDVLETTSDIVPKSGDKFSKKLEITKKQLEVVKARMLKKLD
ncbi:MAG: M28 family peptidase [Roseivirga sp.]|nr:M28 family peptidase [Roseivirga sp.]